MFGWKGICKEGGNSLWNQEVLVPSGPTLPNSLCHHALLFLKENCELTFLAFWSPSPLKLQKSWKVQQDMLGKAVEWNSDLSSLKWVKNPNMALTRFSSSLLVLASCNRRPISLPNMGYSVVKFNYFQQTSRAWPTSLSFVKISGVQLPEIPFLTLHFLPRSSFNLQGSRSYLYTLYSNLKGWGGSRKGRKGKRGREEAKKEGREAGREGGKGRRERRVGKERRGRWGRKGRRERGEGGEGEKGKQGKEEGVYLNFCSEC